MNKKQIMQKILIFFAIIIGSLFLQQKVNAETFQPIGTGTTNRNATNAYVNTQNWGSVKIWQYTTGGSNSVTDNVYCANKGGTFVGKHNYTKYNLYDESKKDTYKVVKDNYNKILWVLDNVYIDKNVDANVQANMIENLKKVTNGSVNSQIDYITSHGNKNEIFYEIAQMLLWRYTGNINGSPGNITAFKYGNQTITQAKDVYNALAGVADKQAGYRSYNLDSNGLKTYISRLSFNSNQAKLSGKTAGPFILNNYDEKYNLPSTWSVTLNGNNQVKDKDYTVRRDGNKFYIDFTNNLPTSGTVKATLNIKSIITTGSYWVQDKGGQQLISIDKSVYSKAIPATVIGSSKYYIDVVKRDSATGKMVSGAKFSIKSDDEKTTYKEGLSGEDWGNLKTDTFESSNTFTITEEEAPEGYINAFKGLKIKLKISIDSGNLSPEINIYDGDNDVTFDYIFDLKVGIIEKQDENNVVRIGLFVADPGEVSYDLKVLKKSKVTNDPLKSAKFNVYESDKSTLKGELVTEQNGYSNTLSYKVNELDKDLDKIYIKETAAPEGYKIDMQDFIEIQTHVNANGTITLTNPIDNEYVKTYMTTINKVPTVIVQVLDSPNNVKYNIKIVKKDAITGEEIKDKTFDIRGFIMQDCPDVNDEERYSFKFTSGGSFVEEYDALQIEQDLETIWVSEITAPEGYQNNLGTIEQDGVTCRIFAKFVPHIDKDGNLSVTGASSDGGFLFFVNPETNVFWGFPKTSKLYNYIEDPKVETIDGVQTIVLTIKDQPKVGGYNIKLVKTNSKGEKIEHKEAKFTINGEEKSTEDGILNIADNKTISQDNQQDVYEIEETEAPEGYGKYNKKISLNIIGKENEDDFELNTDETYLEIDGEKLEKNQTSKDGLVKWNIEDNTITIELVNKYFDLALRKWVTQAIVTENGQTVVTETGHKAEDDPEEVVKVDLRKSKIDDVIVKFKYSIRITNEGEIAGEATKIRDDVPEGLKFVQEDNPDWKIEDGKLVTEKLAGTTLQPGESAEVEILLTWVNSKENMGVMINTAEIEEDHNDYGAPDIDSTPGNNVPGEDDIDDAPVMLTIKTGSEIVMYISIALGTILIVTTGIIVIKKKVLVD